MIELYTPIDAVQYALTLPLIAHESGSAIANRSNKVAFAIPFSFAAHVYRIGALLPAFLGAFRSRKRSEQVYKLSFMVCVANIWCKVYSDVSLCFLM